MWFVTHNWEAQWVTELFDSDGAPTALGSQWKDEVDRVQGMEMMVNELKLIGPSYRVVAWFWFPGAYNAWWPYSGLFNYDGSLSTLGQKYKELAGA